jgi:hypothetical protein
VTDLVFGFRSALHGVGLRRVGQKTGASWGFAVTDLGLRGDRLGDRLGFVTESVTDLVFGFHSALHDVGLRRVWQKKRNQVCHHEAPSGSGAPNPNIRSRDANYLLENI